MSKKRRRDRIKAANDWTLWVREDFTKEEEANIDAKTLFHNNRYHVYVKLISTLWGDMLHLSIKRNDRGVWRDWRDLQRIKNEIAGPECEAVEMFPAESRMVDTANQYHLWVLPPGKRFPFGFTQRLVASKPGGIAEQRPFENPPEDAIDMSMMPLDWVNAKCELCTKPMGRRPYSIISDENGGARVAHVLCVDRIDQQEPQNEIPPVDTSEP